MNKPAPVVISTTKNSVEKVVCVCDQCEFPLNIRIEGKVYSLIKTKAGKLRLGDMAVESTH